MPVASREDFSAPHRNVVTTFPVGTHPDVVVEAQLMNRRRVAGSTPRRACVRIVCMLVSALLVFGLYILIVKTHASEKNGKRDDDNSYDDDDDDGINDDNAASITVLKPTEGSIYGHGDKVLIQWESSGLTVNDEGETNIDVYLCTGWGDMSCYKNRKCHYQLEWDDSHKEGYATFYYTIGNIYVCLEDTKFYSVYGYSGEFTITDDRRLSDAWRLPQYSNFSYNALESKSDVHSRHEPRHLSRLLKGGVEKRQKIQRHAHGQK